MGQYMVRFLGSSVSRLGSIYLYAYDRSMNRHMGQLRLFRRLGLGRILLSLICTYLSVCAKCIVGVLLLREGLGNVLGSRNEWGR